MKIEKRPNGYYRVRQQHNGKRYSINFDHKPSVKEINIAMAQRMTSQGDNSPNKGTLDEYAQKYLSSLEKGDKSPTTVKGYKSIQKNTPKWFRDTELSKVTDDDVKRLLEEYGADHSAKSIRNMYSFWHCILTEYKPYLRLSVKLPPREKRFVYEPTTDDIKRILEYSKGSRYYLALRLASIGLRRGEFCAITEKDLDDKNVLTINKDMVVNGDNEQIIKNTPKTDASNRRILIPEDIASLIRENKTVFDGNMHTINEYLHKCQQALEIPSFNLHILRHFAAAYMLKNGFTSIQIEDYMGWEHGSTVMQKVYAYNLDPHDSQQDIASIFSELG